MLEALAYVGIVAGGWAIVWGIAWSLGAVLQWFAVKRKR